MEKNNICIHEEKHFFLGYIRQGLGGPGGGLNALTDMSAKNVSSFLDGSPNHIIYSGSADYRRVHVCI